MSLLSARLAVHLDAIVLAFMKWPDCLTQLNGVIGKLAHPMLCHLRRLHCDSLGILLVLSGCRTSLVCQRINRLFGLARVGCCLLYVCMVVSLCAWTAG